MRLLTVKPERVLVPGEYKLGNKSILQIYFRVFDKNQEHILPPSIVVNSKVGGTHECIERRGFSEFQLQCLPQFISEDKFQKIMSLYEKERDYYYLIDGNHRTTAAVLTHKQITALELQTDDDLFELRRLVRRGELFRFDREETSLQDLVKSFENHVCENLDKFRTVAERTGDLVSNNCLPAYMTVRYANNQKV